MKKISMLLASLALLAFSMPGHAGISYGGFTREGYFDWLDLKLTQGHSPSEILAGYAGYIDDGWRYATTAEFDSLFGGVVEGQIYHLPYLGQISQQLGWTYVRDGYPDGHSDVAVLGFYDDGTADPRYGLGEIDLNFPIVNSVRWMSTDDALEDVALPYVGSFLVRQWDFPPSAGVPEPGTLVLFGAGLVALGFAKRRKRSSAVMGVS